MNILVTELIWPEGLDELEASGCVAYDPDLWRDPRRLRKEVEIVDALIVCNQTRVDAALLESGASLKAIGRLGVGLDNIDLAAARDREISIIYARNANAVSVAEYVMAAILHCLRDLSGANEDVRVGNWDRKRFTGSEACGKTLGLVGVGEISQRTGRRAGAFGMRVLGYDPYVAPYDYAPVETWIELVDMDTLLSEADFVSLQVPLTESTSNLFSLAVFRKMKPSAWLINTSRGGVVNEADLAYALDEEIIEGAVLDVLEEEPISKNNPLLGRDRVVLTPHIAGLTEETQVKSSVLVAEEVVKVLRGEPSLCVVGP